MSNVLVSLCRKRSSFNSPDDKEYVKSEMRRWTLRCQDLLARVSFVNTQVDRATGQIMLHVTGAKPVVLSVADAARLRRQLGEAMEAAAGQACEK